MNVELCTYNSLGGIIIHEDLRNATALLKPVVITSLENGKMTVYGPPPPSSGAVVQFALNILDGGCTRTDTYTFIYSMAEK